MRFAVRRRLAGVPFRPPACPGHFVFSQIKSKNCKNVCRESSHTGYAKAHSRRIRQSTIVLAMRLRENGCERWNGHRCSSKAVVMLEGAWAPADGTGCALESAASLFPGPFEFECLSRWRGKPISSCELRTPKSLHTCDRGTPKITTPVSSPQHERACEEADL